MKDDLNEQVNGKVEIRNGDTYWMGTLVHPCPMCGIAPTNVDDCGEFGNPDCPTFGIGREKYERKYCKSKPKLMLLGYGRHGKDTVAEILRDDYGYTFSSSSWAAAKHAVFPVLGPKYGYTSVEECFNDRANHRQEWYDLIKAYNTPDLTKLATRIYEQADIYVGIRDRDEFYAAFAAGLFDYAIWVDASKRLPLESTDSCTVQPKDADIILDNNGLEDDLPIQVQRVLETLEYLHTETQAVIKNLKR